MLHVLLHHPIQKVASGAVGLSVGATTFLDIAPKIAGLVVSLMSAVWLGVQFYYFIKDRKDKK